MNDPESEEKEAPNGQETGTYRHHPEELEQLKSFFRSHGRTVTWVAVILLAAVLAGRAYRGHRLSAARNAAAAFATAGSVQDLEALVNEHKASPTAPLARLRLAKAYFDASNYELAMNVYGEVRDKHGEHPLAVSAEMGLAHCLEAKGQTEEALRGFEEFLERNPEHFLAPQAVFGKARCLDQLGRTRDAKATIEDYIASHPESRWTASADEMLGELNRRLTSAAAAAADGDADSQAGRSPLTVETAVERPHSLEGSAIGDP